MTLDPNWLYSSTAQSAAAIVALMGGFITSRLLGLAAEKRTLEQQKLNIASKMNAVKLLKEQLQESNETNKARKLLNTELGLARLMGEDIPSFEQIKERHPGSEIPEDILGRAYEVEVKKIRGARAFIEDMVKIHPADNNDLEDWLRKNKIDIRDLDPWELEGPYERARDEYRDSHPKPPDRLSPWANLPFISPIMDRDATNRAAESRIRQDEAMEQEIRDAEKERYFLERELYSLTERIMAFGYPPHLWFGFGVLVYFAIVGILYPLAQMPANIEAYDASAQWWTLGLFTSGLAAVFLYVAFHMWTLKRS